MKKIRLLASICMLALLMGGCANTVESTPVEDSSEAVSEIPEVHNDVQEPTDQDPGQDTELSGQNAENSKQDTELSEQDVELINMGIHNNEHNIYTGNIGNQEIRMMITRTEDSLSAAYITRDDEEKVFQGELKKDSAGFILNADSGDYLEGSISSGDNGGISINGVGMISANEVTFTLRQDTFFPKDVDTENYYSSLGYIAEEAEQFAKQIKDSVNDKTAFAKLISYPISIEIDGSNVSIENEVEMLDVYDKLIEQNGFKQQIETIYTQYMFANYMGICVENGIIWFQQDSSGDYKIYAINVPENNLVIEDIAAGNEKHYWINRQGEIFDSTNAPGGVDESLDTIAWMAFREGTIISEDLSAGENDYILESNQVLDGSEEAEDHVWIRIEQEAYIPQEGALGQVSHKDYIFYVQEEDAYVGVQSAEDTGLWTILEMADYGGWLRKEIDIYVRMTTGL